MEFWISAFQVKSNQKDVWWPKLARFRPSMLGEATHDNEINNYGFTYRRMLFQLQTNNTIAVGQFYVPIRI